MQSLPAFLHIVDTMETPAKLQSSRFGVIEFHHPKVVELIDRASPVTPLGEHLSSFITRNGGAPLEGSAVELYKRLLEDDPRCFGASRRTQLTSATNSRGSQNSAVGETWSAKKPAGLGKTGDNRPYGKSPRSRPEIPGDTSSSSPCPPRVGGGGRRTKKKLPSTGGGKIGTPRLPG